MITEVNGIILSYTDYKESSRILNVLTKEYGLIGILSRGCRKLKSNLRSVSDKLTYGVFNIFYKETGLSTLISVDIINEFRNIKLDISKISYASFLCELAGSVYKQNNNKDIFDILEAGLIKINDNFDSMVITNIIELKFLDYLGVMPVIDGCSICSKTSDIVTISASAGGYVCSSCITNEKIVTSKTIKLIRMLYYVDISKIEKLELDNKSKQEINEFLDEYYDSYTGLYLKSKNFIKNLSKVVV